MLLVGANKPPIEHSNCQLYILRCSSSLISLAILVILVHSMGSPIVHGVNQPTNHTNPSNMNSSSTSLAQVWTHRRLSKVGAKISKISDEHQMPNPNINNAGHNITKILTAFFEHGYDKRVRPNYSGPPAMVNVSFHIIGISSVSEVQMDFTTDFYFRQKWYDSRLMFEPIGEIKELCVGAEFAEKIWLPDTFFANEKTATFHKATTENTFIRIGHEGRVYRSIRLTVTCSCPMDLQYFPMDRQRCKIEIESYGYNTRDIDYRWEKGNESVSMDTKIELPQFKILGHRMGHELQNLSSGDYIRLYCEIHFVRSMGYYLIQIYIPASLIVIISWVSFWLHRNATPARVALGVTTVLTMTTLMSSTNAALPKISYVKSIDVFLGTCFVMVFASLLEYATVGYVGKRISMKSKRQQEQQKLHQHHQRVCLAAAAAAVGCTNQNFVKFSKQPVVEPLEILSQSDRFVVGKSCTISYKGASRHHDLVGPQQNQKQLVRQASGQFETHTLASNQLTTMASYSAPLSQPIAVRRLIPESDPIYGQRSSIKFMVGPRQAQSPIYKQSVIDQIRANDSESVPPMIGIDNRSSHAPQLNQQHLQQQPLVQQQQQQIGDPKENIHTLNGPAYTNNKTVALPVTSPSDPAPESEAPASTKDMIKICGCTPSIIDKYSRVLFPICFVCFNLMYWIIYGHISGQIDDKGPPLIDFIKS